MEYEVMYTFLSENECNTMLGTDAMPMSKHTLHCSVELHSHLVVHMASLTTGRDWRNLRH